MTPKTEAFISGGGVRIYRIPIQVFPELWGYSHLIVANGTTALIDVGSGFGESSSHLERGLNTVKREFGETIEWNDLTHILITHGHIDHFGGLADVRKRTRAPIGIHELDRRVLTAYEERLATVAAKLHRYLSESGITEEEREDLMNLYLLGKQLYASQTVDFTFEAVGMKIGPVEIIHVPGHTPGQVMLLVDDILLSADHILEHISPHLAPERLTLNTGLAHYLESLEKSRALVDRTKLVLGGHERPFHDLLRRIDNTRSLYKERLALVLDLAQMSATTADIAQGLFGDTAGYHRLLALEEAGAYIEYLSMRGLLAIENLESLEHGNGASIRYRSEGTELQWEDMAAVKDTKIGELDVRV